MAHNEQVEEQDANEMDNGGDAVYYSWGETTAQPHLDDPGAQNCSDNPQVSLPRHYSLHESGTSSQGQLQPPPAVAVELEVATTDM